jgi:hypothetical protein
MLEDSGCKIIHVIWTISLLHACKLVHVLQQCAAISVCLADSRIPSFRVAKARCLDTTAFRSWFRLMLILQTSSYVNSPLKSANFYVQAKTCY